MSNPSSAITLPPGYHPALLVVTEDDHSAWIVIATALGMACLLIFVAARILVRYSVTSGFGKDDWLLASSVVVALIQSSILLYGCSLGLGATMLHMSAENQIKVQKVSYTSNLFWVIAIGLSKVSVTFMLQRIDAFGKRKAVFHAVAGLLISWTIASNFAIALQCNLSHPWITLHERCSGSLLRWQLISAFDILTELLLLGAAMYLVWSIQTSISKKAIVVTGFACRLLIIIAIAFRLATFDTDGFTTNPSLRETLFTVWTQTELNYSIISATIPSLLQFMRDLNTQFGGLTDQETMTYGTYGSNKRSKGSFPMSILRSANKTNNSSHLASQAAEDDHQPIANSNGGSTLVSAQPEVRSKDSIGSNDSQRMIIRREVGYTVQYE